MIISERPKLPGSLYVVHALIWGRWCRITAPTEYLTCKSLVEARKELKLRGDEYRIMELHEYVTASVN